MVGEVEELPVQALVRPRVESADAVGTVLPLDAAVQGRRSALPIIVPDPTTCGVEYAVLDGRLVASSLTIAAFVSASI